MTKKVSKTEEKITIQVMAEWYQKFCQSKYYSKMKKTSQKYSERAILDLLCIMYYEFNIEPDEWSPEAMEKYCLGKLLDELYHEREEDYFRYVLEILLYFFNFLKDFKLQKNAEAILKVIQIHGSEIFESYQEMSEEDEEDYSDEKREEITEEIEELLKEFTETKYFLELNEKYKESCEDIILTFAGFMYDYTRLSPKRWDTSGLWEICLDVMPRKVVADDEYFESITPSLKAFFLFMDERKINHNALKLAKRVDEMGSDIVKASKKSSNWGIGKQLLNQAVSKGIDISNTNKLTKFLNSMMGKPLPIPPVEEDETEEEYTEPEEYDNLAPFVRKTEKIGRNDPCPCGSGKKYKKCCGK